MNDDFHVPYLSPPIWELLNKPVRYYPRRCDQCDGVGRFITYCWRKSGDCVDCPVCDGTGIVYVYVA